EKSAIKRPKEQLAAFERIHLGPGEKKTLTLELPAERFAFWDTEGRKFKVERGRFDIMVGGASDDIRQRASLEVTQ
ncbi:MAG: fibronectin type III-like domain-contianing protein, partial [Bryobacteraceae bacterium]